jgi:tetratricopeptide (TPR) repeat protein
MDPANPIVKLCVQGMEQESQGNLSQAAKLFEQAWAESSNDFEKCIAAHYVARHQPDAAQTLEWNQAAMDCANRTGDGTVMEFLPSLHLNLGNSYEDLGNLSEARQQYECAADRLAALPPGAYREIVHDGIQRGLHRVDEKLLLR